MIIPLLEMSLRSIPTGTQYQDMLDLVHWIGTFFGWLFNIELPWFNFKFGELIIGPAFLFMLYGVFKLIFSSVGSIGGGGHDD